MKHAIIKTTDLCKSFANNGRQNHVLDMVNLEIYEEDFTVIMGSSGAGKSTLLYTISGMDAATSGSVQYRGTELVGCREKEMADIRARKFGFIFQQMHLVSNLTLFENAAVVGYLDGTRSKKEVDLRVETLLCKMHVEHAKDRLPSQVSGGEAQRAAIARALINEPDIIFADEPTGALNKHNTKEVLDLLTEINRQGQSVLMVTHDVRAAICGNRFLYLEDGRIIGEMTMPPYEKENAKSREKQLDAWLSSMAW